MGVRDQSAIQAAQRTAEVSDDFRKDFFRLPGFAAQQVRFRFQALRLGGVGIALGAGLMRGAGLGGVRQGLHGRIQYRLSGAKRFRTGCANQ